VLFLILRYNLIVLLLSRPSSSAERKHLFLRLLVVSSSPAVALCLIAPRKAKDEWECMLLVERNPQPNSLSLAWLPFCAHSMTGQESQPLA